MADVPQKSVPSPHQDVYPPTDDMSELAIESETTNKPTFKSVTDQMHEDIVRQVGLLSILKPRLT